MSKNYHNRLDKLEDELQSLLLLQEVASNQQGYCDETTCQGLSSVAEVPYEDMEEEEQWQCAYQPPQCPAANQAPVDTYQYPPYQPVCPALNTIPMETDYREPTQPSKKCPRFSRRPVEQPTQDVEQVNVNPQVCPNKRRPCRPEVDQTQEDLVIEDIYIREPSNNQLNPFDRRRSSSAPPEKQSSYGKQKAIKDCVPSCSKWKSNPEYNQETKDCVPTCSKWKSNPENNQETKDCVPTCSKWKSTPDYNQDNADCDAVASKFDYAIEQLRMERQQFKDLQDTNNKLREMLANARASAKEASDSRRTSLDYSRQVTERMESAKKEFQDLKDAMEQLKKENQQLIDENKDLNDKIGCASRRSSLQSEEDKNVLVATNAKANALEQKLRDCEQDRRDLDLRYQELVKKKREEENILQCAIRDSETRARDAERRVKEVEERSMEAERRAEEALKKMRSADQALRSKESQLQQETVRRKSTDENTQAELKRCQDKMVKMADRVRAVEEQRDSLEKQLQKAQQDVLKKIAEQEDDFNAFRESCREKEEQIARERIEMARVVQDLKAVAKEHKDKVDELTGIMAQQDRVIASQKEALRKKDEQVDLANKEMEAVREKSAELDKQIRSLHHSVDILQRNSNSDENGLAENQQLLAKAKQALDAERDKLLIKDKIIDDQTGTIKQLKMQLQDRGDSHRQDCRELEMQLKAEKKRTKSLEADLEDCMWNKQEMENRIAELEEGDGACPAESFSRHDHLLRQLELQIEAKQKEWELQMRLIQQEKETACNAAKFATRKLELVTIEFRKKLATYEKVQRLLSAMLKEKDAVLAEANEKIRDANFKVKQLSMSVVCRSPLAEPPSYPSDESDDGCNCRGYDQNIVRQQQVVRPSLCPAFQSGGNRQYQNYRNHPYQ